MTPATRAALDALKLELQAKHIDSRDRESPIRARWRLFVDQPGDGAYFLCLLDPAQTISREKTVVLLSNEEILAYESFVDDDGEGLATDDVTARREQLETKWFDAGKFVCNFRYEALSIAQAFLEVSELLDDEDS